MTATAAR